MFKVCIPAPLLGAGTAPHTRFVCGATTDIPDPLTLDEWRETALADRCHGCQAGYENHVIAGMEDLLAWVAA